MWGPFPFQFHKHCLLSLPGGEEFPAITDIPSGNEAPCPFTTTSTTPGMARICFYEDKSHYIKWERGKTVCLEQPRQHGQSCPMDVKMIKIHIRPPNPQRLENKCQKEVIPYWGWCLEAEEGNACARPPLVLYVPSISLWGSSSGRTLALSSLCNPIIA